jgi:hypothetical protein
VLVLTLPYLLLYKYKNKWKKIELTRKAEASKKTNHPKSFISLLYQNVKILIGSPPLALIILVSNSIIFLILKKMPVLTEKLHVAQVKYNNSD